jgi:hypothetical protein
MTLSEKNIFKVLLFSFTLLIIVFYTLAAFGSEENSDTVCAFIFVREILNGNFLFNGWQFAKTSQYAEFLFQAPFVAIFGYKEIFYDVFPSFYWAAALLFAALALSVSAKGVDYKKAFFIMLFSFGMSAYMSALQLQSLFHGASFSLACLSFFLVSVYYFNPSIKLYYAIFAVNFFMLFSDTMPLFYYLIPMTAALIFLRLRKIGINPLPLILQFVYAFVAAIILTKIIKYTGGFVLLDSHHNTVGLHTFVENIAAFFKGIALVFGFDFSLSAVSIAAAFFLTIFLLIFLVICVSEQLKTPAFTVLTAFFSLCVSAAAFLTSAHFGNGSNMRFFFPSIILVEIAAISSAYKYIEKKRGVLIFAGILFFLANFCLLPSFHTSQNNRVHKDIAALLESEGLQYGYASYWNSFVLSSASNFKNEIVPVSPRDYPDERGIYQSPMFTDSSWYIKPANFLILDEYRMFNELGARTGDIKDYEIYRFALERFGTPARELSLHGRRILIWNYDISERLSYVYLRFRSFKREIINDAWEAKGKNGSLIGFLNSYDKPLEITVEMILESESDTVLYFNGAVKESASLKNGVKTPCVLSFTIKPGRTNLIFNSTSGFKITNLQYKRN